MSDDEESTAGAGNPAGAGAGAFVDTSYNNNIKCNMQPPDLNKFNCYETFKDRVELWELTTDISPKKLGLLLANSLPDVSKIFGNNIATSLLKKYKAKDLFCDDGLTKVVQFLDDRLGKTKVLSVISAWEKIDRYNKKSDQGIVEFIADFDLRYNTILNAGIPLPSNIAAYMLLLRADLNNTQYELLKGVIDLNAEAEKDTLYQKVKEKM